MLDRQNIINDQESEKSRIKLNELRAMTAAVESCGQSKAEAQANAERSIIEANSNIEQIRLRAEAAKIEFEAELKKLNEVGFVRFVFVFVLFCFVLVYLYCYNFLNDKSLVFLCVKF